MATRPPAAPSSRTFGVPTTTPIALLCDGTLFLDRMSVLGLDGCGVITDATPKAGTVVSVVFHLSSAAAVTRCQAKVVGAVPTTPAGVAHAEKTGKAPPITSAGISDSATAIFRMSDLERLHKEKLAQEAPAPAPSETEALRGISLAFIDLDAAGKAAVANHLQTSRQLADQLAAQGGTSVPAARLAIAESFHEGDLPKRALDW